MSGNGLINGGLAGAPGSGGGGGSSKWEVVSGNTLQPLASGAYTDLLVNSSAADSRDAPQNTIIFKNTGLANNPQFRFGNPYVAGVGLEAWGVWYTDDLLGGVWQIILSGERSGTFAAILDGVRRSGVEVFINNGGEKPFMRIEASSQGINFGPGDSLVLAGNAVRSSNVLTCTTETEHKLAVGDLLWKQGGDVANFGADGALWGSGGVTRTVASVPSTTSFTVSDTRANHTNAADLNFSGETDVTFGRDTRNTAAIRVAGSSILRVYSTYVATVSGIPLLCEGSSLDLGANGTVSLAAKATEVEVKDGRVLNNQGKYRSQIWYNGGGETQSAQECFVVGTGSASTTTLLPAGLEGQRLEIKNEGQGTAHTLQIIPNGAETINNGSASYTIAAGAAVILRYTSGDWHIWYCPPPP